jgi:hypothetical protein
VSSPVEADPASASSGINPFAGPTQTPSRPGPARPAVPIQVTQQGNPGQPGAPRRHGGQRSMPPPFDVARSTPSPPRPGSSRAEQAIGLGVELGQAPPTDQPPIGYPGYGCAYPGHGGAKTGYPTPASAYPTPAPTYPAAQAHPATPPAGGRRAPSAMHVPMRTLGEPPAGLGPSPGMVPPAMGSAPGMGATGFPKLSEHSGLPRYWWVFALVGVVVLAALGIGTWALLGGGSSDNDYQRLKAHGLSYQVPKSWTSQGESDLPWVRTTHAQNAIHAQGVGLGQQFSCGGQQHPRASVGVLQVYRNDNKAPRPEDAVSDLGMSYAATVYGDDALAKISDPHSTTVSNTPAVISLVSVHPSAHSECAVSGQITVIALRSPEPGPNGQATIRVFMLQHDTAGGPKSSGLLSEQDVNLIVAKVKLTGS